MSASPGPPSAEQIEATAREGADSVFRYVERIAEPQADGIRWQTVDWHNRPRYDTSLGTGVAGITLFLSDYVRLSSNRDGQDSQQSEISRRALDLAAGGLRWCSSAERTVSPDDDWKRYGLMSGESGLGLAWLRLHAATRDAQHLERAIAAGDQVLAKGPGPVTDWQDGAAGEGLFLLRLAQASAGPERSPFLDGATRWAEWLASVAVRNEQGVYWPWEIGSEHEGWYGLSFVPGSSGIAYFLICLFQVTHETRWANLAGDAASLLRQQAVADRGGLNWPDTLDGLRRGEELRCQWCYGASGVGQLFVTMHEALGSSPGTGYLATAQAAGECTFNYGDVRRNPVQCHGLAGSAELFLELYRATREPRWLHRAYDFARRMMAYRTATPEGDLWQADDPGVSSPDFLYGAAGTGHCFLRLLAPLSLTRPML